MIRIRRPWLIAGSNRSTARRKRKAWRSFGFPLSYLKPHFNRLPKIDYK